MPPVNPTDPNQQPQGPGNNQPLQPKVQKLRFEDIADVDQIQSEMSRIFKVSAVVEKEEKKSAEIHLKYLKLIETAERHKHTLLVREHKEVIKLLEDEMRVQKNLAMGNEPAGPKRVAAGKRVEEEFRKKIADVNSSQMPKTAAAGLRAMASEGHGVFAAATTGLANLIEVLPKLASVMGVVSIAATVLLAVFKLGMDRLADLTKLQAQLRAGGMGLDESGRSVVSAQKAFSILGQNMEELGQSTDDVNRLVAELAKAPDALKELTEAGGAKAWKTMRDAAGEFGVTAQDTAEMVVTAAKTQNLSMVDLSKMFLNASHVAKSSRIQFKDAFNGLLGVNAEMRNLTFNTDEARKLFTATSFVLRNLSDLKLSQADVQKFTASIAGAIGGMTVEKLTGVLAFVKGRMPTETELEKGLGLNTIVDYMAKAMGHNFNGPQSLVKISSLMNGLGIQLGNNPVQGAKAMKQVLLAFQKDHGTVLQKVLDDSLAEQETGSEKQAKRAAKEMAHAQKTGFESMAQMVTPLGKLETALGDFANNFVGGFMPVFSTFAANFDRFVKITSFGSVKQGATNALHGFEHIFQRAGGYPSVVQHDMATSVREAQYKKMQAYKQSQIGTRY